MTYQPELIAAAVVLLATFGALAFARMVVGMFRRMLMVFVLGVVCAAFAFYGNSIFQQAGGVIKEYKGPVPTFNLMQLVRP